MLRNKGFSLVELMIVVVVIGILVTIAIPNYARSVERAKCAQAMGTVKSMRNAMGSWFAATGEFTGADPTVLGNEAHASFANNNDWSFAVVSAAATTYQISATRSAGPWSGQQILVNEMGDYTASTYPFTNAGGW